MADLLTNTPQARTEITFTFYWPGTEGWEGADFVVRTQEKYD